MSQWTHINGNVRLDAFGSLDEMEKELKDLLGPQTRDEGSLEDAERNIGKYKLPLGSEGTMSYAITPIYDNQKDTVGGQLKEIELALFGNLRDFGLGEGMYGATKYGAIEIKPWFKKTLESISNMRSVIIRQAILDVSIEDYPESKHIILYLADNSGVKHWEADIREIDIHW